MKRYATAIVAVSVVIFFGLVMALRRGPALDSTRNRAGYHQARKDAMPGEPRRGGVSGHRALGEANITSTIDIYSPPDNLRRALRVGSRVDKVIALEIMAFQDKENSSDTYYNDVLAATEDTDVVAALQAIEIALGYYSSELFPHKQRMVSSPERAIQAIQLYVAQGNQVVRRDGPLPNVVSVSVLAVALQLGAMYPTGKVLSSFQDAYNELRRDGNVAAASRIGIILAENGRPPSRDMIKEDLNSADPHVVADAAEVVLLLHDVTMIEDMKSSYANQESDAISKESILNAIYRLNPQDAPRTFLGILAKEECKSRCDQMLYLLRKSGYTNGEIAARLRADASGPDGKITLRVARVLIDLGDDQILPNLRSELTQVTSISHDDLYGKQIVQLLGDARDTGAIGILGYLFSQSKDPVMRAYAKRALENMVNPAASDWLRASRR